MTAHTRSHVSSSHATASMRQAGSLPLTRSAALSLVRIVGAALVAIAWGWLLLTVVLAMGTS